jgi:hypothetical protein
VIRQIVAILGKANERLESCWNATAAFIHLIQVCMSALLLGANFTIAGSAPALAQSSGSEARIDFNIPAQPLARALVAYGAVTGLEVFYKAALAERRKSAGVLGSLTPTVALQILLRDTGYVARTTGPGAFTIELEPHEANPTTGTSDTARRIYEPYFAVIQAQISDVICRSADIVSGHDEIVFQLWLAPSGQVARAEVVGDDGNPAEDQTFAIAMRGLAIAAPPAGMPQPVSMVIFPAAKTSKACRSGGGQRRAG